MTTKRLPATVDQLQGLRAALWVRESTQGQYDRYGPDAQREMLARAVRRFGLLDAGLSWAVAESGSTVHKSSAMREMLGAARDGSFDVLLVAYVARWQRNLLQTLNLLEADLHPAGVCVWFEDEELLSSNERHWDQLVDEAKAADSWLRKHRRRVREGYAAKLTRRRDPGGHPPFGFRRGPDKLIEPNPDQLEDVRRIYAISADGLSDQEIATQVGRPIDTVRGVLTSPLYLGRLRDGGPANWEPLVDPEVAQRSAANRARRATNSGRPAAPSRPYALSMLHCAACGARIAGDTGYYRHDKACTAFMAATPPRPKGSRGRKPGKGYERSVYEDAVGGVLDRVALGAEAMTKVVGLVVSPPATPDGAELARIERVREAALGRYLKNRDSRALDDAMERLDAAERDALTPKVAEGIPAAVAVSYLRELSTTWRKADGGKGRRMLAESLFSRIEVLGAREATIHLTSEAQAYGFAAAIPDRVEVIVGYGRGERI